MKRKNYIWSTILVFFMIVGLLGLNSCKKKAASAPDVIGPAGFKVTVSGTASPSTLYVPASDPAVGAIIKALVRDNKGNPLEDTKVVFEGGAYGYFENFAVSDFRMTNAQGEAQIAYFIGPGANVKATVSTLIKVTVPTDGRIDINIVSEVVDFIPIKIIPYITQGITLGGRVATAAGNGIENMPIQFEGASTGVTLTDKSGYYEFFTAPGWWGTINPDDSDYSFTPDEYLFEETSPIYGDTTNLDFIAEFGPGQGLAVDVSSWEVEVEGGTMTVNVFNQTGDAKIDYTITPDHSWIHVSRRSGTTPGSFTITVDENKTGEQRTGTVELNATNQEQSDVTINITQLGNEVNSQSRLEVDRETLTFEWDSADAITVNVFNRKTTDSIDYLITVLEEWILVSKQSGSTDDTIEVRVAGNDTGDPRTGKITLTVTSSGSSNSQLEITVNQTAGPAVAVNPETYTASAAGGDTFVVYVFDKNDNDTEISWTATNDDSWIFLTPTSGTENNSFNVTVQTANPTTNPRIAVITITEDNGTTATVTITQKGKGS